jgi:hypothetical protein
LRIRWPASQSAVSLAVKTRVLLALTNLLLAGGLFRVGIGVA